MLKGIEQFCNKEDKSKTDVVVLENDDNDEQLRSHFMNFLYNLVNFLDGC